MGRFHSTVAYYAEARQPYGAVFFSEVAERLRFTSSMRLLDVGTGPGILALGFSPFVGEAMGVDPEPAMVEAARETAARNALPADFVEGRIEDLGQEAGIFDVVTIGRAIHWLDPEAARRKLERLTHTESRVLVCNALSAADGRNPWLPAYEKIRERWKVKRTASDPAAFFAGSCFSATETISVDTLYPIPVERLADRVLSMSSSSEDRLGGAVSEMRAAVRAALEPYAREGTVVDVVEAKAQVFQRAQ